MRRLSFQVRHAAWVTLCVMEDFCMPIANYTLDGALCFYPCMRIYETLVAGLFEESKIIIRKPLRTVR